jgi:hypothetical protein
MNDNENCVVAYFVSDALADNAIAELRKWDERVKDIKLGTIGKILREADGTVKVDIIHKGGMFKNHLHLSDTDLATIGAELKDAMVAVAVNADDYEVSMLETNLRVAGGSVIPLGNVYDTVERAEAEKQLKNDIAEARFDQHQDDAFIDMGLHGGERF